MQDTSVGFVGGGRVASIILGGWRRADAMPNKVVVSDCSPTALNSLQSAHHTIKSAGADNLLAAAQDVVFLAVPPPVIKEILPALRPALQPDSLIVSLAPKFTIAKLSEMLGGFARIARVIPNAPSIVARGFNPVAFAAALSQSDRQMLMQLLRPLGDCPEVDESKLEAYAVLTAMGPTYFWFQFYELLSLANSFGLTPDEAQRGLSSMLSGADAVVTQSGLPPERVKDLIPAKPLADIESPVCEAYRSKLAAVFEKIRP